MAFQEGKGRTFALRQGQDPSHFYLQSLSVIILQAGILGVAPCHDWWLYYSSPATQAGAFWTLQFTYPLRSSSPSDYHWAGCSFSPFVGCATTHWGLTSLRSPRPYRHYLLTLVFTELHKSLAYIQVEKMQIKVRKKSVFLEKGGW